MSVALGDIWDQSWSYYSAHLTDKERLHMTSIRSHQDLIDKTQDLLSLYTSDKIARLLRKTQTCVAQLKSFTAVINIFTQIKPDVAGLLWGPLALILEVLDHDTASLLYHVSITQKISCADTVKLAVRHSVSLELITDNIERMERALPRFQHYIQEFGTSDVSGRLTGALIDYFAELIGHYQDTITFLRVHPLSQPSSPLHGYLPRLTEPHELVQCIRAHADSVSNSWPIENFLFLNSAAIRFNIAANKRVAAIKENAERVDTEARLVIGETQHRRLEQLLTPKETSHVSPTLPYRSLPYRNNHFHYRSGIFEQLTTYLQPGNTSPLLRIVGLYGLGGVGKSQVAAEFAHRNYSQYDVILWLKAENESKLKQSIRAYANRLRENGTPSSGSDAVVVRDFYHWLTNTTVSGKLTLTSDTRHVQSSLPMAY